MKIAQIAPPWFSIPSSPYGGAELVVSLVTENLVERGHKVTLFASGDSKTKGQLVPIWSKGAKQSNLSCPGAVFPLLYNEVLKRADQFDIIHDHCEFYTAPLSKFINSPIVSTLHNPMHEEVIMTLKKFPDINYVAISKNQRRAAPGVNFVKTIYNGIPLEKYEFQEKPEDYILWLSNITPGKGLAEAIEIAKKASQKLIVAGKVPKEYQDYFEYRIEPLIDGEQTQFVGGADFSKKVELFKNARAFIFPLRRPEPFGLAATESMACGTPVITYKRGAMPELIRHGKTGYIVESEPEMISAIKKIDKINRKDCREQVKRKFGVEKMINKYEALYYTILKKNSKR